VVREESEEGEAVRMEQLILQCGPVLLVSMSHIR
jgi:hypothetical protein